MKFYNSLCATIERENIAGFTIPLRLEAGSEIDGLLVPSGYIPYVKGYGDLQKIALWENELERHGIHGVVDISYHEE